jgi:hypothetical protein
MHVTSLWISSWNSVGGYQKAERSVAIACQSSAMADHNCLTTEETTKVVVNFAKKKKVLLPPREDFGLFLTLIGHMHKTLLFQLHHKFEDEGSVKEEKQPQALVEHLIENV